MSAIEDAVFSGGAQVEDGKMRATAGTARYRLESGQLALSSDTAGAAPPHVANEQIGIDATTIYVTLAGPYISADGTVKSLLLPAKKGGQTKSDTKMPSMLKQDQAVNVLADDLEYDGEAATATYTGAVRLFQGDTTIKGDSIVINDKSGDLSAYGNVVTTVMLDQIKKGPGPQKKERVESIGTADVLMYEEKTRRATYTGNTHVTGPEGDITAGRIELFLKPSGTELDHAEAYADAPEAVTLTESHRKTTAARVTFLADDERYVATGKPVTVVDECGFETKGSTLTFNKAADTILVDGQRKQRTSTTGSGKCPGSQD
jgi:lipopolysaccharide export system protein LptA